MPTSTRRTTYPRHDRPTRPRRRYPPEGPPRVGQAAALSALFTLLALAVLHSIVEFSDPSDMAFSAGVLGMASFSYLLAMLP